MKRIIVITEEIALDTNVVIDAFVVEFTERFSHEQLRNMLNLSYLQDVFVMEYKEGMIDFKTGGERGIRKLNGEKRD